MRLPSVVLPSALSNLKRDRPRRSFAAAKAWRGPFFLGRYENGATIRPWRCELAEAALQSPMPADALPELDQVWVAIALALVKRLSPITMLLSMSSKSAGIRSLIPFLSRKIKICVTKKLT